MFLFVIIIFVVWVIVVILWEMYDDSKIHRNYERERERKQAEAIDYSNRATNYYRGRPEIDIATEEIVKAFEQTCKKSPDKERVELIIGFGEDKISLCSGFFFSDDGGSISFVSREKLFNFKDKGFDVIYPEGFFPNLRHSLAMKGFSDVSVSYEHYHPVQINPYAICVKGKNKYYQKRVVPF